MRKSNYLNTPEPSLLVWSGAFHETPYAYYDFDEPTLFDRCLWALGRGGWRV